MFFKNLAIRHWSFLKSRMIEKKRNPKVDLESNGKKHRRLSTIINIHHNSDPEYEGSHVPSVSFYWSTHAIPMICLLGSKDLEQFETTICVTLAELTSYSKHTLYPSYFLLSYILEKLLGKILSTLSIFFF